MLFDLLLISWNYNVLNGVLLDSILCPVLFNMLINDWNEYINFIQNQRSISFTYEHR